MMTFFSKHKTSSALLHHLPTTKKNGRFHILPPVLNQASLNSRTLSTLSNHLFDSDESIEKMVDAATPLQKELLKDFVSGAMSHGSINQKAHESLAEAMNRIARRLYHASDMRDLRQRKIFTGPMSNSGEGGELEERNETDKQSRIRQVASGRFGVNGKYLAYAHGIQIKLAQAAKPGFGGELPGIKVVGLIAKIRNTEEGITLISPPPHHDIYSIEDLKQLIYDLKSANPHAFISVKLAAGEGIGVIAAGVVKCGADDISIAGAGGGTGAAPLMALYDFALPWEVALAEVHQTLVKEGLRDSVTLTVSGGLQTPYDYFFARLIGDSNNGAVSRLRYELGTSFLVSLGCVMARRCHVGDCPAGIATHNTELILKKFKGTPEHAARFLMETVKSLEEYYIKYGFTNPRDAAGRTDLLRVKDHTPLTELDKLLYQAKNPYFAYGNFKKPEGSSDEEQVVITKIMAGEKNITLTASNKILSFGARIAYHKIMNAEFAAAFKQPITIYFNGVAIGQSFGFIAPTNLILITKHANHGAAKSNDGGTIIATGSSGDQVGYGATQGLFLSPVAGNRFAVRNSGGEFLVEQIGDLGINYQTGGKVGILGEPLDYSFSMDDIPYQAPTLFSEPVGPNFGAGFTGGKVMMPKKRYQILMEKNYLAPDAKKIAPRSLNLEEKQWLRKTTQKYHDYIPERKWVGGLLKNEEAFLDDFIILDPATKTQSIATNPVGNKDYDSIKDNSKMFTAPIMPKKEIFHAFSTEQKKIDLSKKIVDKSVMSSLYSPTKHKDACGTGLLVRRDNQPTRELVKKSLKMLEGFMHRGFKGIDGTGDGCGIMWFGLDDFFKAEFSHLKLIQHEYSIVPIMLPKEPGPEQKTLMLFSQLLKEENLEPYGSRVVKTKREFLGNIGKNQEGNIIQFIILKPKMLTLDEFEKSLIRINLRFILHVQNENYPSIKPHILSASPYYVIYKSLVKENNFGDYFVDFKHPAFKSTGSAVHSRAATNTLPVFLNIQPFVFANNGELNNLKLLRLILSQEPIIKKILKLENIHLEGLSDSHVMSIYMQMLYLLGNSIEEIVQKTIQPYDPIDSVVGDFFNLYTPVPFEGPNASIISFGRKIINVCDKNGFRPQRGLIHSDWVYLGSELGSIPDLDGAIYHAKPGQPFIIDLEKGTALPYRADPKKINKIRTHMQQLKTCHLEHVAAEPVKFESEALALRKLQAGWTPELDKMIMEPLFAFGKIVLVSMGDQGPMEALINGPYFDLGNFLKHNFSQVTNPPLAKNEEKAYMSTKTVIGLKPGLEGLELQENYLLDQPIIDNREMAYFLQQQVLNPIIIDMTYPIYEREKGLKTAINHIVMKSIQAVDQGSHFLVLSDMQSNEQRAGIFPPLIASLVDQALRVRGLRHRVSLVLQAANTLSPRDAAQAIFIGGIDVVNPYLAFIPDKSKPRTPGEYDTRCRNYKLGMREGLLSYMSAVGLSTLSGARSNKSFTGNGIARELADMLGIHSHLGGLTLEQLALITLNNHLTPSKSLGKYDWQGQLNRSPIWQPDVTRKTIESARGNEKAFAMMVKRANLLRSGMPRGQFRLLTPSVWNSQNPMTVCIMGGGAAGFYQTAALLKTKLPLNIVMIEQRHGNKFGLLGDGVAPDHEATKRQSKILRECLMDPRVIYYGGIEIGKKVTYEHLAEIYPCIIDCRGAALDITLDVPGEENVGVIPASKVYKAYNGEFDPFEGNHWPFATHSKNKRIGIVGGGNVAIDVARILLRNPSDLATTNIDKEFLQCLKEDAPTDIDIYIRGHPTQCKITLKELEDLKKLGFWMTASYDTELIKFTDAADEAKMTGIELQQLNMQKKIYDFFRQIHHLKPTLLDEKRLYFHFQVKVKEFRQVGKEVEAVIIHQNGTEYKNTRSRNYVIAIGRKPIPTQTPYISGWAAGFGGTLSAAEASAIKTTEKIVKDFNGGVFNQPMGQPKAQPWQLRSSVGNKEFLSILDWIEAGGRLRTVADFFAARHYQKKVEKISAVPLNRTDAPKIEIKNAEEQTIPKNYANLSQTLLTFLQNKQSATSLPPKAECDGMISCGTCAVEIVPPLQTKPSAKEEAVLKASHHEDNKNARLSCALKVEEVLGRKVHVLEPDQPRRPSP